MWWIAFQVVEGILALFGLVMFIIMIVHLSQSHCKGLSWTHKKEYLAVWKASDNCQCSARNNHKFVTRWICHECETMTEERICKDGAWKIENAKIVPDLVTFARAPGRYDDD